MSDIDEFTTCDFKVKATEHFAVGFLNPRFVIGSDGKFCEGCWYKEYQIALTAARAALDEIYP